MNVLVIGGSGLVGSNLYRFLSANTNWKICSTHKSLPTYFTVYFDVCEPEDNWPAYIKEEKWDVIIHTGAMTNADLCEIQQEESWKQTVGSTINLQKLAEKNGSKLVYISSDYVFDGLSGPYTEEAIPNPINVYGRHKLEAEKIVQQDASNLVVRITNVYGDEIRNKNFVSRNIQRIKDEGVFKLDVALDQFATPINAYDVARAIKLLIESRKGGVYHLGSTDYMSRSQLIEKINHYFGDKIECNLVTTEELSQSAKRPKKGGLLSVKFLSEFNDFKFTNLDDYLSEKH